MLNSGEIEEAVVDDKVRRILRLMFRTNMNPSRPLGRMNNEEHLQVARAVAGEGIVLLKNEGAFFPVDPNKKMTIAVVGENATRRMTTGGGSSDLKARNEISPLSGLQQRFKNATIIHTMGYASGPSAYGRVLPSALDADSLRNAALEAASKADLVLFFGGLNKSHHQDCEGGDRLQYGLPFGQDKLIEDLAKVNSNLGVVLISGNAVAMPWLPDVKGLLQGWFLGSETGHALADVISGDVNPSGKLPFTFPVKLDDNAAHHFGAISYPGDSINQIYKEGILVGYRWHDTKNIKPLFAFGHGLSYTTFEVSNAKTQKKNYTAGEKITVSCNVANTGNVDGSEVVQVYVGKPNSKVERAVKELKGFKKVSVKKGAKASVDISLEVDQLAFYDESISDWNLEKGGYVIYVGTASDKIVEQLKITVQ